MTFYLGTHQPQWLASARVPLFVSRRRLAGRKTFPRAAAPWALDSGGFTEIGMHGRWTLSPRAYVKEVRRYSAEIGRPDFCAPQDWMCEPIMLKKTGLTIEKHQLNTTANYLKLRSIAPDLPWIPVLQGWSLWDYWRHADQYTSVGIDLTKLPRVGVGTVCRRQGTIVAHNILTTLAATGMRLHAFGFKTQGLIRSQGALASSDSMAWSFAARREDPMPGHEARHINCANCLPYALRWRTELLDRIERAWPSQLDLFGKAAA